MVLLVSFEADLTLTQSPPPQTRTLWKGCFLHLALGLVLLNFFVPVFKDLEGCFNCIPLRVLRAIVKFLEL